MKDKKFFVLVIVFLFLNILIQDIDSDLGIKINEQAILYWTSVKIT